MDNPDTSIQIVPTPNETRAAGAILLLARTLGHPAESAVRAALKSARPDIQIGPTDPPDPT